MKHIGIFSTSGDVQTAIYNGTLLNPYVAEVSGALDYNTVEPAPATMGTWSDDGQGVYTFQITETGDTYWEQPVKIGVLNDVYMDGNQDSPDVMLSFSILDKWHIELASNIASSPVEHDFTDSVSDIWLEEGVVTDPNESSASLEVSWDGVDTFVFQRNSSASGPALSMTTINPDYPAGE